MARICEWEHEDDDGIVEVCERPSCGETLVFEEDHVCDDCRTYGPQTGHPDVEAVAFVDYCLEHAKLALEQPNVRLWDDEWDKAWD